MSTMTLLILAVALIFSGRLTKFALKRVNDKFEGEYFKYGFLSRYYLNNNLSPSKFEEWCKYILENMHYKNLKNVSESIEGGINLISINNNIPTYISTRLYGLQPGEKGNTNDNYIKVGRPEIQKFVGALVHDKVYNGVIITTGDFTGEAVEYVKSLPNEYLIVLLDGIALTKELRKIRKREITARVAFGLVG
jgi:restriction endonuclease Mrr